MLLKSGDDSPGRDKNKHTKDYRVNQTEKIHLEKAGDA
jgi:hypothetical protein